MFTSETCNGTADDIVPSTLVVSDNGASGVYSENYGGSPACEYYSSFAIAYSGGSSVSSCSGTGGDSCTAGDNTDAGYFSYSVSGNTLTLTSSTSGNCSGGTQVTIFTLE